MSASTGTTSSASVYTTPAFWERLWRTAGIQSVLCFIVAYIVYGHQPQVGASADALAAFYDGDRMRIRHRARERSQHEACPYEVVQARCEHVISRAGDGIREGCDHCDEQEEKRSEGGTGGGRRRAPTVLSRIRQGGPERPREPHEIEDSQAVKHGRDHLSWLRRLGSGGPA